MKSCSGWAGEDYRSTPKAATDGSIPFSSTIRRCHSLGSCSRTGERLGKTDSMNGCYFADAGFVPVASPSSLRFASSTIG